MSDKLNQIDLLLAGRQTGQMIGDRTMVNLQRTTRGDVMTTHGIDNLAQAILNRLFTRKGELAQLGHPDYGSRLYQLIGNLNNSRTHLLAEAYIRESLAQERRIAEVTSVAVAPPARGSVRNRLELTVTVRPVGVDTLLAVSLSLNLEG
jgi:phage baseplate assembly protein W